MSLHVKSHKTIGTVWPVWLNFSLLELWDSIDNGRHCNYFCTVNETLVVSSTAVISKSSSMLPQSYQVITQLAQKSPQSLVGVNMLTVLSTTAVKHSHPSDFHETAAWQVFASSVFMTQILSQPIFASAVSLWLLTIHFSPTADLSETFSFQTHSNIPRFP